MTCAIPGVGTCDNWNGEIWCGEELAPILKYHCKFGANSQTVAQEKAQTVKGGCYFLRVFLQLLNG